MAAVEPASVDLAGLVDFHVHAAPDVVPRWGDALDVARAAREAGLRAVAIKSHVTLTADGATLVERAVGGGVRVFGGLALNGPVGGFNPEAVEVALKLGAKQIWFPTKWAAHERRQHGVEGGLTVFDDEGQLLPQVKEIVDLIGKANVVLATGHISPEETAAVVELARDVGLRKIVITHPEADFLAIPVEAQVALAGPGVFFERCYISTQAGGPRAPTLADVAAQIRRVGVRSTVLSTDFGLAASPAPPDGLRAYLAGLLGLGFSWNELRHMAADNPAELLGL
ncbi:MAG: DUF6282 family protein [Chloroflexota bacterium]